MAVVSLSIFQLHQLKGQKVKNSWLLWISKNDNTAQDEWEKLKHLSLRAQYLLTIGWFWAVFRRDSGSCKVKDKHTKRKNNNNNNLLLTLLGYLHKHNSISARCRILTILPYADNYCYNRFPSTLEKSYFTDRCCFRLKPLLLLPRRGYHGGYYFLNRVVWIFGQTLS